jgi:hypothetical protein
MITDVPELAVLVLTAWVTGGTVLQTFTWVRIETDLVDGVTFISVGAQNVSTNNELSTCRPTTSNEPQVGESEDEEE